MLCINKLTYVINKCCLMILINLSLGGNYLYNNNFLLVLNFWDIFYINHFLSYISKNECMREWVSEWEWVSECCLMPGKQMFKVNTSYIWTRWLWCPLCTRLTIEFNFIVLVHWNNSPLVDMSFHSGTVSWFRANKSLLLLLNDSCLAEKQPINSLRFVQIGARTHDLPHETNMITITPPRG
jgi:hypothetical protein